MHKAVVVHARKRNAIEVYFLRGVCYYYYYCFIWGDEDRADDRGLPMIRCAWHLLPSTTPVLLASVRECIREQRGWRRHFRSTDLDPVPKTSDNGGGSLNSVVVVFTDRELLISVRWQSVQYQRSSCIREKWHLLIEQSRRVQDWSLEAFVYNQPVSSIQLPKTSNISWYETKHGLYLVNLTTLVSLPMSVASENS